MRRTRLILGSIVAVVLVGASPASAYVDSGTDPEGDSTHEDSYDIDSTTRSVVQGARHRNLRITTRTYGSDFQLDSWAYIAAKVDSRGGRQADAVLRIWVLDLEGNGCELVTRSGRLLSRGILQFVSEREGSDDGTPEHFGVSCRVPMHPLPATKTIRWKVSTISGNGEPVFDVAPNEGMYR